MPGSGRKTLSSTRRCGLRRGLLVAVASLAMWAAADAATPESPPSGGGTEAVPTSPTLTLDIGEIEHLSLQDVSRIAIGDPNVADLTLLSPREVLIQGKGAGKTNLIIWDRRGEHLWDITVVDPEPLNIESQLRALLQRLDLKEVRLTKEEDKLFLMGTVGSEADMEQLEKLLASFPDVTNLVRVTAPPAKVEPAAPLVKLSVQVVDVSRSDLEKLGVSWSQSVLLKQPEETDRTLGEALMTRIGSGLTRETFSAGINALVEQNRARILAEPKLVTASGKEASSFIGVEVPIIKSTSFSTEATSTSASIEFRQTGVLLTITPKVLSAGGVVTGSPQITSSITAEVSKIDSSVALSIPVGSKSISVPGFKVRKAATEVTTASGEAIVIAGLLEAEDSTAVSQVPALGSMPFLGRLFRSPEIKSSQRELVIVVTPELLSAVEGQPPEEDKTAALERALTVAEVTAQQTAASVSDPVLRYALVVQERIGKAMRYPATGPAGAVGPIMLKLKLHVFKDGTLGRTLIAESSGVESFDLEALKVAETQAPYPSFPSEIAQQDLWLELPIVFRP